MGRKILIDPGHEDFDCEQGRGFSHSEVNRIAVKSRRIQAAGPPDFDVLGNSIEDHSRNRRDPDYAASELQFATHFPW
jgi:hypothetical protein